MRPDYLLVLPWHFRDEEINKENYLESGGKFIFPCLKLKYFKMNSNFNDIFNKNKNQRLHQSKEIF